MSLIIGFTLPLQLRYDDADGRKSFSRYPESPTPSRTCGSSFPRRRLPGGLLMMPEPQKKKPDFAGTPTPPDSRRRQSKPTSWPSATNKPSLAISMGPQTFSVALIRKLLDPCCRLLLVAVRCRWLLFVCRRLLSLVAVVGCFWFKTFLGSYCSYSPKSNSFTPSYDVKSLHEKQ